jgi:carboxypeptidase C (cathepsin A)
MADEDATNSKDDNAGAKADHTAPEGAQTTGTWTRDGVSIDYTATAQWTVLRKKERAAAEIFSVSYLAEQEDDRPLTFVFNGGPGASSAYLHMGAAGPQRVAFPADGTLPQMPPRLVPNDNSWLAFTDLVFVDPVGTGFSRVIDDASKNDGEKKTPDGDEGEKAKEYFGYKRDLESLSEFMARWLSAHDRWGSPVFIAGESYGGYRVGRLVRMLQETTGIGLNGAILISPALEFAPLAPTDYDLLGWVDLVPTMTLAAVHHGRSRAFAAGAASEDVLHEAETFATGEYTTLLARGASMPPGDRERILGHLADLIGLPADVVTRAEGRV